MKKLVLTLVLGVFAFGSSGFDTQELQQDPSQDCLNDAWDYGTRAASLLVYPNTEEARNQFAYLAMEYYIEENC
ncbi:MULTISPECIES: hypothetical protein [Psychroflexus]|uniref:Uncharacterized protein n=2 Tax=Psychroflexus TaxID=83612 RepID=A0A917E892_9FLAO|nr:MULTISPECIES: hypothetical protein [Psychroflexus]GGE14619.1 hypothetical protein GCM10010831_14970 [Psychroflexus salis]GGE44633.1 hypothetical protein GCM10010832_25750 [Psychroflexus planctonicus]